MKKTGMIAVMLFSLATAYGQQTTGSKVAGEFTVFNRKVSIINEGAESIIHLNEAQGPGIAWINGMQFTGGTIEFDIKGKDVLQQSFLGIAFHGLNDNTYEAVYFRPFNFRAADPARKAHAVQYVAIPQFDWPKLRADSPNQYEKPVDPSPDPNHWFHVKLEITGEKLSVFVDNNSKPVLETKLLGNLNGKMIGYWAGNNSSGDWKNLKVSPAP